MGDNGDSRKKSKRIFPNIFSNFNRKSKSFSHGVAKKIMEKNSSPIKRTLTIDSTVVHNEQDDDNETVVSEFEALSKREQYLSSTRLKLVRENYDQLTTATEIRSVNNLIKQKTYMNDKMSSRNKSLKQMLRRSVDRTRFSRSSRRLNKKMSRRFDNTFGRLERIGSGEDNSDKEEGNKVNKSQNLGIKAKKAMLIKEKLDNLEKEEQEKAENVLIEGKIEQLKLSGMGKIWKKRYGVLTPIGLFYYDSKDDYEMKSEAVKNLKFGDLVAKNGEICSLIVGHKAYSKFDRSYIFSLHTEREQFYFAVRKNVALGKWQRQLNKAFKAFLFNRGKEAAVRNMLRSTWVSPIQWTNLQSALKDPKRENVAEVTVTIKDSLLHYLEDLVLKRVNLRRKQVAFLAWKTMYQMERKGVKNEQIFAVLHRHSLVNFQLDVNETQLNGAANKRVSFKRMPKGTSNRRLKNKQKSKGFIQKKDTLDLDLV